MGVMLVLGRQEDLCCQLVQDELRRAGREVWFLLEDHLFPGLRLTWTPSNHDQAGSIEYGGRSARLADIDGVLCRCYGIPIQPEEFGTPDGQFVSAEWNALLMAWLHDLRCPVVNRLRPELWYKTSLNVPDLMSIAPDASLALPRALVTTVSEDGRAFYRRVSGQVRYSPLTQPATYRIQTDAQSEQLAALEGVLPFYLTEWVEGRPVDAFVIGSETVFVDADGEIDGAPSATKERCVALVSRLGLGFCRLSLVDADDGHWYCLGLDRAPQLWRCTSETQTAVAHQVARFLCSEARS